MPPEETEGFLTDASLIAKRNAPTSLVAFQAPEESEPVTFGGHSLLSS